MKIFFDSSVTGRKIYEEQYRRIDEILKKTGHEVFSAVFLATAKEIAEETGDEAKKYYENLSKWMREADILVFEASYPSLGIGHEMGWGLHLGKHVIVLYKSGNTPYVLEAIEDKRLQVCEYSDDDLEDILKDAVGYAAKNNETRFTMLVQSDISKFLDNVADSGESRSGFIRKLIRKEMGSE